MMTLLYSVPYMEYVFAAYGVTFLTLASATALTLFYYYRRGRELSRLESEVNGDDEV